MYRNYMPKRHCNCGNNNNYEKDYMQEACSNIVNYNTMYDSCECGFDEENNMFPSNPMYGQSYVPIQTMNQTFIPSARTKNGNNISRTC